MKTAIQPHYYEPVFMIGQVPFLAGTIVVRNHMRVLRRRREARRWQRFTIVFWRRPNRSLVTWRRRRKITTPTLVFRGAT